MRIEDEMRTKLQAAFQPRELVIVDESEKHRGHSGWREGGETHFQVTLADAAFAPMSRIERHRAVHAALGKELVGRIHALALQISG
ncbi:MAG: BolA family protein [Paracoccaceae bacterium]